MHTSQLIFGRKPDAILFLLALASAAYLANFRSLIAWDLHPFTPAVKHEAWIEATGWVAATAVFLMLAVARRELAGLAAAWRRQIGLAAFLLLAVASLAWSSQPAASAFRLVALLCTTWIASYAGHVLRREQLLSCFYWLGIATILWSVGVVFADPLVGRDFNPPYDGAWRGVYWHKNHLGNLAALFNAVFLLRVWAWRRAEGWPAVIFALALYALSLVVVAYARSAAGVGLVAISHTLLVALVLWMRYGDRLARRHRTAIFAIAAGLAVVALANLDTLLGLFNRDPTLTGRTSLWGYLFDNNLSRHPWLGAGFGAVWEDRTLRLTAKAALGWGYPVMIGDNGFLDVALNLGLVGLGLFLAFYLNTWRAVLVALNDRPRPANALPMLIVVYSLFANLSYSLFMEIETMLWGMIVVVAFGRTDAEPPGEHPLQ